jgi:hypothetical protein
MKFPSVWFPKARGRDGQMRVISRCFTVAAAVVALSFAALVSAAQTTSAEGQPQIDPKPTALLKKTTDYLTSAKAFSIRLSFTDEVVLLNGQKIGPESAAQVFLRKPDHFRTIRHGVNENLDFYYDV